ncbi:MAG: rhodanese-like domain-containing protein [Acidimicrobiales bacterium]
MVQEVEVVDAAAAVSGGAALIDVREPAEYETGHVPGARLIPLGLLSDRLEDLRHQGPLYVICASGGRSGTAAEWLSNQGVEAYSVAGGTAAWIGAGRPVLVGPHENVA